MNLSRIGNVLKKVSISDGSYNDVIKKASKDMYIESLLNPEIVSSKVPTPLPVSSTTASIAYNFNITPNTLGNFVCVIDPFQNQGFLYQDNSLDGTGTYSTVTYISFPQNANIIDQWRLVSSGVIVRYFGNFNSMSGLLIGAVTSNYTNASADTYCTFSNIEDLPNKRINNLIDGMKLIYSPMDNKATEFTSNSSYANNTHPCKWQYLFVIVGNHCPNDTCIRVDFYRNLEYTTFPSYREYIDQNRMLPVEFELPVLPYTITNAPSDFLYNRPNNSSYNYKLLDYIK